MYPPPEQLCVTGAEGHFYHELNVPLVRAPGSQAQNEMASNAVRPARALTTTAIGRENRVLPPGSEWLYFKLYGGAAILDEILVNTVLPLAQSAVTSGAAFRWFFLRYADPHDHLRVRFHGNPGQLLQQVMPLAFQALNPLVTSGKLWKLELDTYHREIERYGGADAMLVAENIFWADSEAVLEILRELSGDEGMDIRWQIGLASIDSLLSDFGLDEEARRTLVEGWRDLQQREFKIDAAAKQQLSEKFRGERGKLEPLLASGDLSLPWSFAEQALRKRSGRVVDSVKKLRELESKERLTVDLRELVLSFVHMHVNRLIRSAQRAHEFVLYDFLFQLYNGRFARKARSESLSLMS